MTAALLAVLLSAPGCQAEQSSGPASRLWLSGQVNLIAQGHRPFRSPYQGPNSFRSGLSGRLSQVVTLFSGYRLSGRTSVLFHLERTGGGNLSRALGMAGFPNLDTVGLPSGDPYVARVLLHHVIGLGGDSAELSRGPLQLAAKAPARRLEIYAGKLSLPDFFDVNAVGGDSHLQFLNWSMSNNATYGYPADTRGYTYGAVLEYHRGDWIARFGETLQAFADNPDRIDFRFTRSHAENFELEIPASLVRKRAGRVRALAFRSHGPLARFRDAIRGAEIAGEAPDASRWRSPRRKYGFGLNAEQELTADIRAYGRLGWAQGDSESLANTQANAAASGGFDWTGARWRRAEDKFGAAYASSGLSAGHRDYLRRGGVGAVLGDGDLRYGRERATEIYYTAKVAAGVWLSLDVQRISNPGYNRDRGPVVVAALRLHLEGALFKEPR